MGEKQNKPRDLVAEYDEQIRTTLIENVGIRQAITALNKLIVDNKKFITSLQNKIATEETKG